jgi:hypothetical protein
MAKNRPFRYDAASVVRAGTSRSRRPEKRTGDGENRDGEREANGSRETPRRKETTSRGRQPAVTNGRSLVGEAEVAVAMR